MGRGRRREQGLRVVPRPGVQPVGQLQLQRGHIVYQTFSGPRDAAGTVACGGFTCLNVVYMAVSTDGGRTFNDRQVYANPDQNVAYGHQFTNVSIDAAGNVYSVFSDNHYIFYS